VAMITVFIRAAILDFFFFYQHCYDMWWGTLGTVRPFSNFHPNRDVMEIHNALDRKDVGTLVNILTNRNNAQRQVIAAEYKQTTNKDLIASLKKALSGDLEDLLLDLMMLPEHFDAQRLQDAMAGLGTDEEGLMEILSTRSREQLQHINNAFQQRELQRRHKDLEKELRGETSGDFAKLVVALLKVCFFPSGFIFFSWFVDSDLRSLYTSSVAVGPRCISKREKGQRRFMDRDHDLEKLGTPEQW
uniref:Annexin A14 n=1 Tax=Oryzias melastigma TaxID=30732 RepID=A0A3B3C113_ORYME